MSRFHSKFASSWLGITLLAISCQVYPQVATEVESTAYYLHQGERIELLPSKRYVAVALEGFDVDSLNGELFTRVSSSLARKHQLALIARNPSTDDETFDAAVVELLRNNAMGTVFSSGQGDLVLVNEFVLRFSSEDAANDALQGRGVDVISRSSRIANRFLITFPNLSPRQALDELNKIAVLPGVTYSYPNFIIIDPKTQPRGASADSDAADEPPDAPAASAVENLLDQSWPNDLWFSLGFQDTGLGQIRAPLAWQTTTGSCHIKIAVLDDGVDLQHKDLLAKIAPGHDFIDGDAFAQPMTNEAHGTASAGVAAAVTNNLGRGIAGTIWGGKIIPIRIYEGADEEILQPQFVYDAIEKAVALGADIISNSWGLDPAHTTAPIYDDIADLIEEEANAGTIFVFAVGNGSGNAEWPASLASEMDVISVGSTDDFGDLLSSSKSGPGNDKVSLVAPGRGIHTTDISGDDGWVDSGGTDPDYFETFGDSSAAAPFVAGAAGLLLSWSPGASASQVRQWLMDGAAKPAPAVDGPAWGAGMLDIAHSLDLVGSGGVDIDGIMSLPETLGVGDTVIMQYSVTRDGVPLSGVTVTLDYEEQKVAAFDLPDTVVSTDCNGLVNVPIEVLQSSFVATEIVVTASVKGAVAKVPVTVGVMSIRWIWFIAILLGLVLMVAGAAIRRNMASNR